MTLRYALSDIEKMLEMTIANRKFATAQILFWILCIADKIKKSHIEKIDSGAFIHQYDQIVVNTDATTGRKYINLPTGIYDFDGDEGINFLSYDYTIDSCTPAFTSVTFSRTTPSKSKRLYWTEEEIPSPANPYFYRIGSRVDLLGCECVTILNLEGGFMSTFDPNTICDLDAEFDFPQELYDILKRQLLDLARFGLAIPNNRTNTGNYELDEQEQGLPKQKLTSVNQQQDNQEQQ